MQIAPKTALEIYKREGENNILSVAGINGERRHLKAVPRASNEALAGHAQLLGLHDSRAVVLAASCAASAGKKRPLVCDFFDARQKPKRRRREAKACACLPFA